MEILKLLLENPGSGFIILFALGAFLFFCGGTWANITNMRAQLVNMVTVKDLDIALLKLKEELANTYVSWKQCDLTERKKNGFTNGNSEPPKKGGTYL